MIRNVTAAACAGALIAAASLYGCDTLTFPTLPDASLADAADASSNAETGSDATFEANATDAKLACLPRDASWEAATPQVLERKYVCNDTSELLVVCLLDAELKVDCAAAFAGSPECADCILPRDGSHGALTRIGDVVWPNIVDCLMTLSNENPSYARYAANAEACVTSACSSCVSSGSAAYGACVDRARETTCANEWSIASAELDSVFGASDETRHCNPGGSLLQGAAAYARIFCDYRDGGTD